MLDILQNSQFYSLKMHIYFTHAPSMSIYIKTLVGCPCGAPKKIAIGALEILPFGQEDMYSTYHPFSSSAAGGIPAEPAAWTPEENKAFERALVDVPEEAPDRWWRIAVQIPGKAPEDVRLHYLDLLHDVALIDSGRVDPPEYDIDNDDGCGSPEAVPTKEGRRKGVPWTEDEHRRFLEGLERFGRGDWRNISRWAVKTRTPTQVASHAQKFFLRQSVKKDSKRKSIHDITT
ncbi:hypothetical protein HPP92_002828 [Vanilla planifolia]|uniref:Transcription factor MYBS1 n=1 Tax=Vanilla planifolia TaxID=51239 RepID=A0A835SAJ6_VANPL|nr:hypothetical protein HPP92_002828 [Vanilla planifolia]